MRQQSHLKTTYHFQQQDVPPICKNIEDTEICDQTVNGEPYQTLANIMTSFDNHAVRQTRNLPKASIRNSLLLDDVIIDESYPESTYRVD